MTRSRLVTRMLLGALVPLALLAAAMVSTLTTAGASPAAAKPASPLQAPPDHIVISEFRSRGPSPNNYATDEFVEFFNPSGGTITLTGWSLWRSNCAGGSFPIAFGPTPPHMDPLTIPAGGHYLIGGLNYSGIVPADETADIGVTDNGGLALEDGSSTIIDQVGMCPTTTFLEGQPLTPLVGNTDQSYDRNIDSGGMCVDTNNNAVDFFRRSPSDPQNSQSPLTTCGNPTATPPATLTFTPTLTRTPTATRTPSGFRRLTINEVGWGGTEANADDKWIELKNTGPQPLDLGEGWTLETSSGIIIANLRGILPAGGLYLLVHGTDAQATAVATGTPTSDPNACVVFDRRDVTYDQIFTYVLSESGQGLFLINPQGGIEDTADRYGARWPAGKLSPATSMERHDSTISDTTLGAWFTYAGDPTAELEPRDCDGTRVRGTPKHDNWSLGITATPSPTAAPTKRPTAKAPTPFAHMIINEFLPRAGTDWNQDGQVNVYDEFIELKNLGPINVDLKGWKLDDELSTTTPYSIPSLTLKPGDRALFYHSVTNISLPDSGGTVRLINTKGTVIDARGYGPVAEPDQSHCRIPDGYYWRFPCFPTPGNENALTGGAPSPPPIVASLPPPCLLADSVPDPFRQAECLPYGADVMNPQYWDSQAGFREFLVPDKYSKGRTRVQ